MGKEKRKGAELEVDNEAQSLASSMLEEMQAHSSKPLRNGEEEAAVSAPRPSRLGLGAKFIPHSQAAESGAGESLKAKLKADERKKAQKMSESSMSGGKRSRQADDDDEEESRTRAIKPKGQSDKPADNHKLSEKKEKKDKTPNPSTLHSPAPQPSAPHPSAPEGKGAKAPKPQASGKPKPATPSAPSVRKPSFAETKQSKPSDAKKRKGSEDQGERITKKPKDSQGAKSSNPGPKPPKSSGPVKWNPLFNKDKKKKKTRSKKKNLKKDTRPEHQKPGGDKYTGAVAPKA